MKNLNINIWVIVSVIAIWSLGRIINPLRHQVASTAEPLGLFLGSLTFLYIAMQVGLLAYVATLIVRLLRRYGFTMRSRTLGEFVLYVYVAATLVVSLYFIAYELGYIPQTLEIFLLQTQ